MRFLPTRVHGILDYLAVVALFLMPSLLPEGPLARTVFYGAAAGLLLVSLLTRYELGAFKLLPMRAHLALDAMTGLTLLGFAMFLNNEPVIVRAVLAVFGVMDLGTALFTHTEPAQQGETTGAATGATAGANGGGSRSYSSPAAGHDGRL